MEILQKRINQAMNAKGYLQNDLYTDQKDSSKISLIVNGKVKDPRMSTLIKIADALDVSLDYLAGRTDNPLGMCPEELEGLHIDAAARELLRGFEFLSPDGKEAIQDQVNYQLSKSGNNKTSKRTHINKITEVA